MRDSSARSPRRPIDKQGLLMETARRKRANSPPLYAWPAGRARSTYRGARRVSFSELLGSRSDSHRPDRAAFASSP